MSTHYNQHLFICERCSFVDQDGVEKENLGRDLRKSVKELCSLSYPKSEVRVNGSGCLGQCAQGISCVIYPKGEWLLNLRPGDEDKVMSIID